MRGRRLWIRAPDGHRIYEIRNLVVDGRPSHAAYDTGTGNIEVAAAAPEVMKHALFHELCHKSMDGLSGDEAEAIFENESREDAEEKLCLYLEKTLYELLTRNGWLKFGPPPSSRGK